MCPVSVFAETSLFAEKCLDGGHQKGQFQQMLNLAKSVNNLEHRAAGSLKALLSQVPAIELQDIHLERQAADREIDILAHIIVAGRPHSIVCEVKASGQPRHVRIALLQLRNYIHHIEAGAIPFLIAPYLSPEAQALCREQGIGFLDFEGNARLAFDGVFIERQVASKPAAARRELKSIFKPKSAQVLRVMFRDPSRAWRVTELANAADVSVGHISNVRAALLDREWARLDAAGLSLTGPDALLDAWRDAYEPPSGERFNFYTTLHGGAFDEAVRKALGTSNLDGNVIFGSFSAAQWLAPYARIGSQFLYVDETGLDKLRQGLVLSSPIKGENVIVTRLKDRGLFRDAIEPAPGIACTSPIQTYLDLSAAGERGREAADHLRHEKLRWTR
jgi:hypothetical protein